MKMSPQQLAEIAIAAAESAKWASPDIRRQLAFGRVAEHLHNCNDARLYESCALTMASALEYVSIHFENINGS